MYCRKDKNSQLERQINDILEVVGGKNKEKEEEEFKPSLLRRFEGKYGF